MLLRTEATGAWRKSRHNYLDWNMSRPVTPSTQTTKIKIIAFINGLHRFWRQKRRQGKLGSLTDSCLKDKLMCLCCCICILETFLVLCFLSHSLVHNPHAVSCFGHRGNQKKAIENYSSGYLGESTVWLKLLAIFRAKITGTACGLNEMMKKIRSLLLCGRVC